MSARGLASESRCGAVGAASVNPVIIGNATLYLGSCEDILPTLPKVDAVVTDPPYGLREAAKTVAARTRETAMWKSAKPTRYYELLHWDNEPASEKLMQEVRRAGVWNVIFGGNYYDCPPASCWLVWDKVNGNSDFADCEMAWTNLPQATRLIRYLWNGFQREKGAQRGDHPTQKPVEVMKWCISHLPDPAETILDPFMGSGTTGVAALQMGRKFIGIEREPRYFEAACRRLRETCGEDVGPLFGSAA